MAPPTRKPKMRISDPAQLEDILRRGQVLRLAMCRDNMPYLVPLNYGLHEGRVYLHTGHQGLKMDILAVNPQVCFEVSVEVELQPGDLACQWNCHYQSVLGFGTARVVQDPEERRLGLLANTAHYAGPGPHDLAPEAVQRACLLCIEIAELTGKRNPAP